MGEPPSHPSTSLTASIPSSGPADPLRDAHLMAELIASVTHRPVDETLQRLEREFRQPGITVAEDFTRRFPDAQPYTPGESLDRFYSESDAFLYETAVWNANRIKRDMRRWIVRRLGGVGRQAAMSNLDVLTVGDGMGFDGVALAAAGHRVTYFELPGPHVQFAQRVFELAGRSVRMVTDPGEITAESFDAVVCLDVLEHVPDPPAFVRVIAGHLREGGRLITHAPFYMIHPAYPTHLKRNRRHSGRMSLYTGAGLRLVDGRAFWNPLVFEKSQKVKTSKSQNAGRPVPPVRRFAITVAGLYYALGRWTALPFYPVHVLRWAHNRWFR